MLKNMLFKKNKKIHCSELLNTHYVPKSKVQRDLNQPELIHCEGYNHKTAGSI